MSKIPIPALAKSVKFSDCSPSASIGSIEVILDVALRSGIGRLAMSTGGATIDLGNGYCLVCKTVKSSAEAPA